MRYKSCAQWDLAVYRGVYNDGITCDDHATKEQAQGVCDGLERYGFGGNGEHFPLKTWVAVISDEF